MKTQLSFPLDKRKGTIGFIIGMILFLIFANLEAAEFGAFFCLIFTLLGFIKSTSSNKFINAGNWVIWIFLVVLCMLWEPFIMIGSNGIYEVKPAVYVLNILLIAAMMLTSISITGKVRTSIFVVSFLIMICLTVNLFVIRYRGTGIQATDLLSIGTALSVARGYSFHFTLYMCLGWSIWLLLMFHSCSFPHPEITLKHTACRIGLLLLALVCTVIVTLHAPYIKIQTWNTEGMRLNGGYLNFFLSLQQSKAQRPQGYSPDMIQQLEDTFGTVEEYDEQELPDIIIVMNESFADLSILSDGGLPTDQEVLPFFRSLSENTIKGYALASVLGGTTANSEYEVLTGNTTAFLPYGACPYQQYIKSDTYSLAWALKDMGYECEYTHPFHSTGWSRSSVVPYLGFETTSFIEEYPQNKLVRQFVSDQEVYEYVFDKLERSADHPQFIFALTIQNHGGYNYSGEHYEQTIHLSGLSRNYPEAEQYLSLIHESDRALEQFIQKLEQRSKDTVVLFFGDHLPGLSTEFYSELLGSKAEASDNTTKLYTVPFFVWANYDIPEQEISLTSLNYLSNYLLEAANIPLPPYNQFLKSVQSQIPAINLYGYHSLQREGILEISDAVETEMEQLQTYRCLQYNSMFDPRNCSSVFFHRAINSRYSLND